jgi:SulP family sulfate permease
MSSVTRTLLPSGNSIASQLVILEATGIIEIDFTAAQILRDLIRRCHADGVDFAVARLESVRAQDAMARFGINELLGSDHLFHSVEEAFQALGKQGPNKDKVSSDGP